MPSRTARWLSATIALGIMGCAGESEERGSAGGGEAAAIDFSLPDLAGNSVSLSGLRGKTVVIDFWATWCAPCIFQIPELNAFHNAHRDDPGVAVLGVSVDAEGLEVVVPYAEEQGIQYTVLLGNESLAKKLGAPGFPWLLILGPDGAPASAHTGFLEHAELEEIVAEIRSGASS